MKRGWVKVVLVILIVLLAAIAGGGYWFTRRGLPKTTGTIESDVTAAVEIYRDQYGVPHIIAQNMEDLFFAQGYAQAQDRLWQMDMSRRGVSGRLSEILGEDFVDTDTFTLTVGFYRAAQQNYELLSPENIALLEAYARGVNAYIEDNRGRLSPEFTLLGYEPEPWKPLDSLAIGVFMSWTLGSNMQAELFHSALIELVGIDLAMEIFPDYPDFGPVVAPALQGENFFSMRDVPALIELSQLAELGGRATYVPGLGSNNWVISGRLTEGGGALLANDMHLGMGLPSIWHTSHLILEGEFNVTGVMFPGSPGIIVGFNDYIAWGVTNTGPDVQDLYMIEINPQNPHQYLYLDQWVNAEVITETFYVDGEAEPRTLEVLVTRHGPIVSGVVDLEQPMSLRWTALEGTSEVAAIIELMRARDWEEFIAALEKFLVPTQNFVYADREGNIGFRANGLIPIRRNGTGLLPVDGTTDRYEWEGYIPWDQLPTLYNPPEGIIVTANHRIVDNYYPYFITAHWAPPYRAMGIWREFEGETQFSLTDMKRVQTSFYNTQAEVLSVVLTDALKGATLNEMETTALTLFEAWLREPIESADKAAPAIYNALYLELLEQTFADEMGETLFERFLHNRASINAFDRMLLSGESGWFNNIETEVQESRDDVIILAFRNTVAFLAETLGDEPADWRWGDLHTITFQHNLGAIDLLARIYNRGPFPIGGSGLTPANMSYLLTDPFAVTHSAPWRFLIDLSDHSAFDSLAIGNSGHPFSKHYDDQLQMWLAGEYKEMLFSPETVRGLPDKLILDPQ